MKQQALEFSSIIQEGVIRLPVEYGDFNNQRAKVIVLLQPDEEPLLQRERLVAIFKEMENQTMFSDINDPVTWQKQLRNEWE
ncbi:MAG: hypothetical protein AAGJ93_07400 [Bacteroidota bacterium]